MPPGLPVHVIQRGNNRQTIFCSDEDMATYASYIRKAAWRNLIGEVLDAELITKIRQQRTGHPRLNKEPDTHDFTPRTRQDPQNSVCLRIGRAPF